ncbi:LOG family protein [Streptomyces sp. FXJ1.4098]|nr:LOG family protein [Streptomyces sp. FXJ1.4098]
MGAVARGASGGGAPILGVIPEFLRAKEMGDDLPPQEIVLTGDLLERKRVMIDRSDAFIALPGGYGTLDEVLEVVSMAALGQDVGPIVLLDVDDDWRSLLDYVDGLERRVSCATRASCAWPRPRSRLSTWSHRPVPSRGGSSAGRQAAP